MDTTELKQHTITTLCDLAELHNGFEEIKKILSAMERRAILVARCHAEHTGLDVAALDKIVSQAIADDPGASLPVGFFDD